MFMFARLVLMTSCVMIASISFASTKRPDLDPGYGYGSKNLEVCIPTDDVICEKKFTKHGYQSPKRVTWFVPTFLKNLYKAPVVIYLHGYFSLVPEVYQSHINHLTRQGYIVIFPQFQGGLWNLITESGVFKETVQQDWLNNAIKSVDYVLKRLGTRVDYDQIFGYGHSLGGAMLLGWEASGGVRLSGMVLANAQTNPAEGMPDFVRRMVNVRPLNWVKQARAIGGNVMVLTGIDDTLALPRTAREIALSLMFAKKVSVYELQTDRYGTQPLVADHMAAATNGEIPRVFSKLADFLGGRIELNAYDYRFYFAALDAVLRGDMEPEFNLGYWSDGKPVAGPEYVVP